MSFDPYRKYRTHKHDKVFNATIDEVRISPDKGEWLFRVQGLPIAHPKDYYARVRISVRAKKYTDRISSVHFIVSTFPRQVEFGKLHQRPVDDLWTFVGNSAYQDEDSTGAYIQRRFVGDLHVDDALQYMTNYGLLGPFARTKNMTTSQHVEAFRDAVQSRILTDIQQLKAPNDVFERSIGCTLHYLYRSKLVDMLPTIAKYIATPSLYELDSRGKIQQIM